MEYEQNISIDIKTDLFQDNKQLLSILLQDKTTKRNLIWATNNYEKYGVRYLSNKPISIDLITGIYGNVIKPRIEKTEKEQQIRIRDKAEVFTPSWVCNVQNNLIDDAWFGYKGSFNREVSNGWITSTEKIKFPTKDNKNWQDYVVENRLEVSCGEAPYLTSRYDAVSGKYINVDDRIGFLDRKLRVVSENVDDEIEWLDWSSKALKSIYGYDYQGDNVLIARQNLLSTVSEFYEEKFRKTIDIDNLQNYTKILVWNIWQMDGTKYVVPMSCKKEDVTIINFFGEFGEEVLSTNCKGCLKNDNLLHNGIYCRIMDWEKRKSIKFVDLLGGR